MNPPVFAHGHLRLYLLSLLAEQPRHGYELILALEQKFGGTYSPSAGTIYPRLSKLEDESLVTRSQDGRKAVYNITDAGRAELAARAHELDSIENDVSDSVRRLADEVRSNVNQAMKSLRADLAAAAREARRDATKDEPKVSTVSRDSASSRLREAEMILNEFRHQLRADLRGLASRTELTEITLAELRSQLDAVRANFAAKK